MTRPNDPARDLAAEFAALNEYLRTDQDQAGGMQRLVNLAAAVVPGCSWAAITSWPDNSKPHTRASTNTVADDADQLQYDYGEGPCLQATTGDEPVVSADLDAETRWPRFRVAARSRTSVRGVLSFRLTKDPEQTALNLYAAEPGAFDSHAVNAGALFAVHARVLMLHADSARQAATLTEALSTSRQIGAAIGILMSTHKVTNDEAFELLRNTSQQLNRKLREIADDVTTTGELPGDM